MTLIYVAAPYNHPSLEVRAERIQQVERFLAKLLSDGRHAFSPLLLHHVLNCGYTITEDQDFWDTLCFQLLAGSDFMYILGLDGWDRSRGVAEEIRFCQKAGIPYEVYNPTDDILLPPITKEV